MSLEINLSEQTEKRIDIARESYRPSAERASFLYFILVDLATIDPMYQFSLESYIELYSLSISKSAKAEDIDERIAYLKEHHTYSVYIHTCRALFGKHKLLFAFQMTIKILEGAGKINKLEYDFLLRGGQVLDKESQPQNQFADW